MVGVGYSCIVLMSLRPASSLCEEHQSRHLYMVILCYVKYSYFAHVQGSIRDNIAYGCDNAKDEEIIGAAIAANAMPFIKKAPAGFKTLASSTCLHALPGIDCTLWNQHA